MSGPITVTLPLEEFERLRGLDRADDRRLDDAIAAIVNHVSARHHPTHAYALPHVHETWLLCVALHDAVLRTQGGS